MAYPREVRLGLVLYGGVSLAVYENGVAQELHRAICGEDVYGLICKLIDSDIVVDIISGTSAGAVNGVMLAYALANKRQFAPSADLWREQGDIQRLLGKPDDPSSPSVLNSTYYHDKLADCFDKELTSFESTGKPAPEVTELDLFVTSTDANGALSTVYDDLGHAIDIKNHRALFKLSYRGPRKNDLDANSKDLATLCRMTSCFPAAFAPVPIGDHDHDPNFYRWGKLRKPAVYLDGGILNNKPFTSTIDAIAMRTATREVERFLIYVEPSPERFVPTEAPPVSPSIPNAALDAKVSIPGYQSIAADLQAIQAHNQRADQMAQIVDWVEDARAEAAKADPDWLAKAAGADCLASARVLSNQATSSDHVAYHSARLMQIRDAAVEAILDDSKGRGYFPTKEIIEKQKSLSQDQTPATSDDLEARRSGRILVQSFDQWGGDWRDTLLQYDVFFRLRRAGQLSKTLMRTARKNTIVETQLWDTVNHFFKLYEIAQWAMVSLLAKYPFEWKKLSRENPQLDTMSEYDQNKKLEAISKEIWGQVQKQLDGLLHAEIEVPTEQTATGRKAFYERLNNSGDYAETIDPSRQNLLDAIDDRLKDALNSLTQSTDANVREVGKQLRTEFCLFPDLDRQLFPMQFGSDFMSTDTIRVVRFSPLDAQLYLSEGKVEDKVRGITLAAFGGFFRKDWRANDIMVGRLDAACLMVQCLLTKERLALLVNQRRITPGCVATDEILGNFPGLDRDTAERLKEQIDAYLTHAENPPEDAWEDLVKAIVEVAQNRIYCEEQPRVDKCKQDQEREWGLYRRLKKRPRNPPMPNPPQCQPVAPGKQPLGKFVDEVPRHILFELGGLASIRLGKGLLASENPQLRKSNILHRIVFHGLAPAVHRFGVMRRTWLRW